METSIYKISTLLQEPLPQELLELHHAEEEQVRMVLLPVTVTGKRGRSIKNLDPDDFSVFEEMLAAVADPYGDGPDEAADALAPEPAEVVQRTFCGT